MSTNNTFSFARLALVMKRDFMENWKTNLYRFLGPYAGFLIVMLFCYMGDCDYATFAAVVLGAFTLVLFFGGAYYASYIMETMNTQQKRISFLMLPATSLEKFVCRALYVQPSLHGNSVIFPNEYGEESKLNLEVLFNAMLAERVRMQQMFNR